MGLFGRKKKDLVLEGALEGTVQSGVLTADEAVVARADVGTGGA